MKALLAMAALLALPAIRAVDAQRLTEPLVFASERHGNTDLYFSDPLASGVRRLTHDPAPDELPRCSPDGPYTKRTGKHDRVAVMNADGSNVRFLTDDTWHDTHPGVSADGIEVVHHTYRYGGDTELQVITLGSGASRRLTTAPGYDYEPSFAGPGRVIFSSNRGGGDYRIYVLDVASGATRLLADAGTDAWASRYDPRSNSVIFNAGKSGAWRLFLVGIDGGTPSPILDDGFSNYNGAWCGR